MLAPNLYATLVDRASKAPAHNIEANLVERFNALARGFAPELTEAFREVYTAGMRDGFVQGVAAASEEGDTKLKVCEDQLRRIFEAASSALACDAGELLDLIRDVEKARNEGR